MNSLLQKIMRNAWFHAHVLLLRNRVLCHLPISVQANLVYCRHFHRLINWKRPRNLIEKIYWLERYGDTSLWTLCADKYAVREYVRQKGCDALLNKLYGYWTDPWEIDFPSLPGNLILKTTNGCGQAIKVIDGVVMVVGGGKVLRSN